MDNYVKAYWECLMGRRRWGLFILRTGERSRFYPPYQTLGRHMP